MSSTENPPRRKIKVVEVVLVLLLAGFCSLGYLTLVPANPIKVIANQKNLEQLAVDIPAHQQQWEAHNITSYEITVELLSMPLCQESVRLRVENGVITDRAIVGGTSLFHYTPDQPPEEISPCVRNAIGIEEMFKHASDDLENTSPDDMWSYHPREGEIEVKFDPDYGFITYYRTELYEVFDSTFWVTFSDFEPIPDVSDDG